MQESLCGICLWYGQRKCESYGIIVNFDDIGHCKAFMVDKDVVPILLKHKNEIEKAKQYI